MRLRAALDEIEEMAEERHLLHGRIGSAFWNCTRPCCKRAAAFLRANGEISPQEAQAAYESAVPVPMTKAEIDGIVKFVIENSEPRAKPSPPGGES